MLISNYIFSAIIGSSGCNIWTIVWLQTCSVSSKVNEMNPKMNVLCKMLHVFSKQHKNIKSGFLHQSQHFFPSLFNIPFLTRLIFIVLPAVRISSRCVAESKESVVNERQQQTSLATVKTQHEIM